MPDTEPTLSAGRVGILERVAMGAPLKEILETCLRLCEDIASDPLWVDYRALALPHGLRSCWSTPIFDAERKVLGTFAIYYRQPYLPTPWHRRIIQVITPLASVAIASQRTRDSLRRSEERRRRLLEERGRSALERTLIFERISDAFVALDKDWHYTHVNPKAAQFFGRETSSLIGKHMWTEFPEGKGQKFHKAYEEAMSTQRMIMLEEYRDITDRKQAEEALKRSNERPAPAIQVSSRVGVVNTPENGGNR